MFAISQVQKETASISPYRMSPDS